MVLALPEDHDDAVPVPRMVEEVFENYLPVMGLRFGRAEIRTTIEHPFWVEGRGWTLANLLVEGDRFRSHDGSTVVLTGIEYSLGMSKVYNMRIEEYHTFFVGSPTWGFSVWTHNNNASTPGIPNPCGTAAVPNSGVATAAPNRAEADARKAQDYDDALLSPHDREFYADSPGLQERYDRDTHYPNSPTKADRKALGAGPGDVVDHNPPLVKRYYDGDPSIGEPPGRMMTPEERAASAADRSRMRLQPKVDSDRQGLEMQRYAAQRAGELGL